MNDAVELLVMLGLSFALIAIMVILAAVVFAAPGFVILAAFGYTPIGFWNSAGAGLGSMLILNGMIGIIVALRK